MTHLLEVQLSSSSTFEKVHNTINLFQYMLSCECFKEIVHKSPLFYNQMLDKCAELKDHENCTAELHELCKELLVRMN